MRCTNRKLRFRLDPLTKNDWGDNGPTWSHVLLGGRVAMHRDMLQSSRASREPSSGQRSSGEEVNDADANADAVVVVVVVVAVVNDRAMSSVGVMSL